MTRPLLLRGVRPYGSGDPVDLLVRNGVIAELGAGVDATGAEVLDGGGLVVLPGLVDLHVHLREPGREDAETIATARPRRHWVATPRCSRWPIPTRWQTPRWSSNTCTGAGVRSGWSMCTRSVRSPRGCAVSGWPKLAQLAYSAAHSFHVAWLCAK